MVGAKCCSFEALDPLGKNKYLESQRPEIWGYFLSIADYFEV